MHVERKRQHVLVAMSLGLLLAAHSATAEVIELEGTIKAIDAGTRAVTIARQTPKGEKVLELEVAKNAGDLAAFQRGDQVSVTYDPTLELISAMAMRVSDELLLAAGSEWVSEVGSLRLRILSRDGDKYTALFMLGENQIREVKGTISGNKIQWVAKDVTAIKGSPGGDNYGVLSHDGKGPRLDFEWKGSDGQGGQFSLRQKSKLGAPVAVTLTKGVLADNWHSADPAREGNWRLQDDVLTCRNDGASLVSNQRFRNFELSMEFRLPPRCNSGIYLRGCYEIQLLDSTWRSPAGDPPKPLQRAGALYGQIAPAIDAYRGPNQWNKLVARLQGAVLTLHLNDEKVIDSVAIPKPTPGGPCGDLLQGPIMIQAQSDMSGAQFRNIIVVPLEE